jgi:hypothetical protein
MDVRLQYIKALVERVTNNMQGETSHAKYIAYNMRRIKSQARKYYNSNPEDEICWVKSK